MLYDVILMRQAGRRRLRADLLREVPMRGDVAVAEGRPMEGLVATLTAAGAVLARMDHARITRMAGSSLVLAGTQTLPDGLTERQEWWCREVRGGPPQPYDPDPPSAVARDLSYAPSWPDWLPQFAAAKPCQ